MRCFFFFFALKSKMTILMWTKMTSFTRKAEKSISNAMLFTRFTVIFIFLSTQYISTEPVFLLAC